ncbi:MAG: hypothetical protein WBC49_05660 [Thermoplasmata archaeon]
MDGTRRQGGRKKLVPAMDRELKCPHTYCEEEELRLEIDCSACPGDQDIRNRRCMSGIVQILSSEAVPQTVILKRHIHKRYRESSLVPAREAARELAVLTRTKTLLEPASDRRCQTCSASTSNVAGNLRYMLLDDPITYMKDASAIARRVRATAGPANCDKGPGCVETSLSPSTRGSEVS